MEIDDQEELVVALRCAADVMNDPKRAHKAMTTAEAAIAANLWNRRLWDGMAMAVAKVTGDRSAAFDLEGEERQLAFLRAAAEVEAATP